MVSVSSRRSSQGIINWSLTLYFVILNVVIYLVIFSISLISSFTHSSFPSWIVSFLALNPQSLIQQGTFWTLFTSMFTHFGFSHLLFNMISLLFIGSFVERLIGRRRYFWFYMISGIVAGLFFVLFAYIGTSFAGGPALFGRISDSAVGASGALFGLGGLLAVLMPRLPVLVFFVIPLPMWAAMAVLMVGLWLISLASGWPIGNTAHLGGLVAGLLYGWFLRLKYARKVAVLNQRVLGA